MRRTFSAIASSHARGECGPTSLEECAVRVRERRLGDVLGVVEVAELAQRGAVHLPPMESVQAFERLIDLVARLSRRCSTSEVNEVGPTADTAGV